MRTTVGYRRHHAGTIETGVRVREALTESDFAGGAAVVADQWTGTGFPAGFSTANEVYEAARSRQQRAAVTGVAVDGSGKILGHVLVEHADPDHRLIVNEQRFSVATMARTRLLWEIGGLAVSPESAGVGIGSALVDWAHSRVPAGHGLVMCAWSGSAGSVKIIRRRGGVLLGTDVHADTEYGMWVLEAADASRDVNRPGPLDRVTGKMI